MYSTSKPPPQASRHFSAFLTALKISLISATNHASKSASKFKKFSGTGGKDPISDFCYKK
jgi:hypothetical protein